LVVTAFMRSRLYSNPINRVTTNDSTRHSKIDGPLGARAALTVLCVAFTAERTALHCPRNEQLVIENRAKGAIRPCKCFKRIVAKSAKPATRGGVP
jgi:hypothetical protein